MILSFIKEIGISRGDVKQFRKCKFSILEKCQGTEFQKKVWMEILKIEFGEVKTYKEVAVSIGRPKAFRAVASACGKNKFPILIPCHRVVSSSGIGGYTMKFKTPFLFFNLEPSSCGKILKKHILEFEKYSKLGNI